MLALWIGVAISGLAVATMASRRAVDRASGLMAGTRVPPFVIGTTLFALGTDLPEIANSIVASALDHGDLNVGDSVGSTATQVSLVLGLLPFLVAGAPTVARRFVAVTGGLTVVALGVIALLLMDGYFAQIDGAILIGLWVLSSVIVWRVGGTTGEPELEAAPRSRALDAVLVLVFLGLVGAGAGAAVWATVQAAEILGLPEYMIAFFATSIGTSLPELVVDVTALQRGQRDLAIGDAFGSSLVDATLSIGIGPALFPVAVTADLATRGSVLALGVVAVATALLALRGRLDRWTGIALLAIYAALYPLLLAQ